ncbi:MAG: hypothetical protein IKR18_05875 [Bacteroidaceae bacterium]|nr:hypothetical protein [Bacteroidaceae bacterium]
MRKHRSVIIEYIVGVDLTGAPIADFRWKKMNDYDELIRRVDYLKD